MQKMMFKGLSRMDVDMNIINKEFEETDPALRKKFGRLIQLTWDRMNKIYNWVNPKVHKCQLYNSNLLKDFG